MIHTAEYRCLVCRTKELHGYYRKMPPEQIDCVWCGSKMQWTGNLGRDYKVFEDYYRDIISRIKFIYGEPSSFDDSSERCRYFVSKQLSRLVTSCFECPEAASYCFL